MFDYIFPIFAFGLVISGIVFLGLQQAADLAKALAEQRRGTETSSSQPEAVSTSLKPNPPPPPLAKPNHSISRP
jgi:hypothetical protein